MRSVGIVAGALLLSGCATHRLIVEHPNPTGEPVTVNSSAFGWGAVQRRTAANCDTDIIDEVRVHQNFGQALATVLTLGAWMPTTIEYRCGKPRATTGSTDQ